MSHQVPAKEDTARMIELGYFASVFLDGRRDEEDALMRTLYRPPELKEGPQRNFHERMLFYDILSVGWQVLQDRAAQMKDRDEHD